MACSTYMYDATITEINILEEGLPASAVVVFTLHRPDNPVTKHSTAWMGLGPAALGTDPVPRLDWLLGGALYRTDEERKV